MVDLVIVCGEFPKLLLTLSPEDEGVPPLKVMVGSLRDVHALHGLVGLYTVLSIDNPALLISYLLPRSRPLGCLGHQTKYLPRGPVGHIDEEVSGLLHAMHFVGTNGPIKLSSLHLTSCFASTPKTKKLCNSVQNFS